MGGRRWAAILAIGMSLMAGAVLTQPATSADGWLKPHCQNGSAALGKRPGIVRFSVSCHRGKGLFFRFVISRGDRAGKHVTISAFSRRPQLSGPGAVASHGFCQRLRQELACRGRGRGKVRLQGWIKVPTIRQCRSRILLVQVVPSALQSESGTLQRCFEGGLTVQRHPARLLRSHPGRIAAAIRLPTPTPSSFQFDGDPLPEWHRQMPSDLAPSLGDPVGGSLVAGLHLDWLRKDPGAFAGADLASGDHLREVLRSRMVLALGSHRRSILARDACSQSDLRCRLRSRRAGG